MKKIVLGILILVGLTHGADICEAVAMKTVGADESPDSKIYKGEYQTGISQYRVDKKTKKSLFCSHGGYCYPRYIYKNGQKIEALRLTNCKIGKLNDDYDGILWYSVDVDRSKNSPKELAYNDLYDRFSDMGGICNACADNIAQYVMNKPSSTCAIIAKKALRGNKQALYILQQFPQYCKWKY